MTEPLIDQAMTTTSEQAEIVIEEESLREDYTKIPNTILKRADISPGAKLAYVMLLSYAHKVDRCFPGQKRLAEDMGVGVRSIIRYLKELVSSQLLAVTRRGLGKTNLYRLLRWSRPQGRGSEATPSDKPHTGASNAGSANLASQEVQHWQTEKNKPEKDKTSNAVQLNSMEERGRRDGWTAVGDLVPAVQPGSGAQTRDDWMADEILRHTGDQQSQACYRLIARSCPESLIFEALAELKQAGVTGQVHRSRGALFLSIVRRLCGERGIRDPLVKHQPAADRASHDWSLGP